MKKACSKPPSSDTALDEDAPVCGADRKAAVAVADAEDDWEARSRPRDTTHDLDLQTLLTTERH